MKTWNSHERKIHERSRILPDNSVTSCFFERIAAVQRLSSFPGRGGCGSNKGRQVAAAGADRVAGLAIPAASSNDASRCFIVDDAAIPPSKGRNFKRTSIGCCAAALWLFLAMLLPACSPPAPETGGPPQPAPLGRVDFPPYEKKVLSNGLTVYALEYHEQPIVAVRLMIAAGAERDPADLPGVASFAAQLLNKGTRTRTATEIASAIDQVGGSLEASANMESTNVTSRALTDSMNLVFELMNDIVMNPAFAAEELAREQQQAESNLVANMQDPDFLADAVLARAIYGNHPYGHLQGGTLKSIPKIRRDDLVNFHDTYYAPNVSALAIVGDLPASESFQLAEQWFGKWEKKNVPGRTRFDVPKLEGRRIVIIDKPDSVQTKIRVGHTTVARNDPDYFKVLVASYILGGSGSGRLYQTLRAERGLTYGAYTGIEPHRGPSDFYSTTDTRTAKTAETLNLLLAQIQKFRSTEVPPEELSNAKSYLIGSFPLSIEVPTDLANRLTTVFLYDLGDNYLNTFRDRLADVTAGDVLRAAREQISADSVAVVLVGKADDFKAQVESLGKAEVIPIDKLDLDSPTLRK
jgi:zinc protease